ncbi:hypothetical protein [Larkinella terrae]|uniref:T9SS type A sorting domain-containing protein n=1 Tax=Larkinella terrae TaxID=2025311 RepID=A0A7K0ELM0_9BACT|nr:hypothetical protein [Larkinella terrae]MRS62396.1 hypothetical protein [Larkinella terrae]
MKTVIASLLIAFCASTASFAGTTTNPTDDKVPFETSVIAFPAHMKLDVIVQNLEGANLTIRLVNEAGITQASQWLNKHEKAFRTRFDISALSDGVYKIIVTDGANTKTQEINISTNVPTPVTNRTISIE